jgi:hypothetical protein
MLLVTTVTYPHNQADAIYARYPKALAMPLPPFLKRVYALMGPGEAGAKVLSIYEVADDKVTDGIKELHKYLSHFFDVEGFRFTLEPMLTVQESIPLRLH